MPPRRRLSTRLLAVAGIVVALIIVLLLAVRISPTAKLALYTICLLCHDRMFEVSLKVRS